MISASPKLSATAGRSPFRFFLLVFALTLPFWALGALMPLELLPKLPISALAVIVPALAAAILEYRRAQWPAVVALLQRSYDFHRIGSVVWFAPILLLMPAIMVASYLIMWGLGWPLPPPDIQVGRALVLFALFLVSGVLEEIGWSGYAIDPLQERLGALRAAVLLGAVWAAWHVIPLLQAERAPLWIAVWTLGTVALRVLTVWIYNNTGKSVFAAALFHAICNLGWQLFPNAGSHYDARITGPIEALVALAIVMVWGARTLTASRARPHLPA
jgi:membrane protease YdiL (CAAX protease family)